MGRPFKPLSMRDFENSPAEKKADREGLKKVNKLRKEGAKMVEKEHGKVAEKIARGGRGK